MTTIPRARVLTLLFSKGVSKHEFPASECTASKDKGGLIMIQVAIAKQGGGRAIALRRRRELSKRGKSAITSLGNKSGDSSDVKKNPVSVPQAQREGMEYKGTGGSARAASLARRKAMSSKGKAAVSSKDRVRVGPGRIGSGHKPEQVLLDKTAEGCGCGCGGAKTETCKSLNKRQEADARSGKSRARFARVPKIPASPAKVAALARRKALSSLGKAGLSGNAMTKAQVARAGNPQLSGRELAKMMRNQRSKNGSAGQKKSVPCGRQRKLTGGKTGSAQDAPWKVGSSVTVRGQTVTGTVVGRKDNMTGDEPGTCQIVTGTEYLGADIFNEFCHNEAKATSASKVVVTSTSHGNPVSGSRIGMGSNVTGNEHGACKRITGGEYTSVEEEARFCGNSPGKPSRKGSTADAMKDGSVASNQAGRFKAGAGRERGARRTSPGTQYKRSVHVGSAPSKVGVSSTLRGGYISGTLVGRDDRVTGDEPGACRNITGDDYIGLEQYSDFCDSVSQRSDSKITVSQTCGGLKVTGDLASRSANVTGDESGTCKVLTGTPYAGMDQYRAFCDETQADTAKARMQPSGRTFGMPLTGQQPGIGGRTTGADKGACEPVSGTPYVGSDQVAEACPAVAAEPGSPDFPQALEKNPWSDFSVTPPAHAAQHERMSSPVTGSQYEGGRITGPFGMASGKVTGTEQARFDRQRNHHSTAPETVETVHGRVKSRITGEGMEAGFKITGDDWDRGDHVTGTEGHSATLRNLTRRGAPMSAMQTRVEMARPEDVSVPVSKVTGGSGNTEKGALVTYSGGARG